MRFELLRGLVFATLATTVTAYGANSKFDSRCGAIANAKLTGVTITAAQSIPAGAFTPPDGSPAIPNLPAFCRVAATLKPTPDSNIRIELWMPEKNWNGRFLGTGNSSGAGKIRYSSLALDSLAFGLERGYATANTDMGTSPDANRDVVIDHPERWADFGYRATHEMTSVSKTILENYYKKPQRRSYFVGCSTGGQQALMEAQRYPDDYNGIVAGAPANNRTHLHSGFIWNLKATTQTPGSVPLTSGQRAFVTNTIVAACAGKDGGSPKDNFLTDPRMCKFDPDTIPKCQQNANNSCLSSAQLIALKQIYAGPANPKTGERIYTPLPFGSENSPLGLAYQQDPGLVGKELYQYRWVFGAHFDTTQFDFEHDQEVLDRKLAPILNANNPDLTGMERNGGKILMFTGTADPLVPFQDALNYYERVVQAQRNGPAGAGKESSSEKSSSGALAKTENFFRYFLVPGMAHCGRGPGLNDVGQVDTVEVPRDSEHDVLAALVKWVEQGTAPDKIIATAFVDASPAKGIRFQRPVCPYPKFPNYVGGDWKSPSSYRCVDHRRDDVLTPAERYLK